MRSVGAESAVSVFPALILHPQSQLESPFHMRKGDAGVAFALDEAAEGSVARLPGVFMRSPVPTWDALKAPASLLRQAARMVRLPLLAHPSPKAECTPKIPLRHPGMALARDEVLQVREPEFPVGLVGVPHPSRERREPGDAIRAQL